MPDPAEGARTRDPLQPFPLVAGAQSNETLTESLLAPVYRRAGWVWWSLVLLAAGGTGLYAFCIGYTFFVGIGAWGNDIPVAWAFAILNFVWWIGFGHAGTLISAILVLMQQRWRASINRLAEAMTLFAVVQAGIYPILHLGRPEYFYWLVPYPTKLTVYPQFRSSLTWDVVAVATYLLVSLIFWYVGLIPDLAAARDRATTRRKRIAYGIACLGWRYSARHWNHWRTGYLLLAALATALVISVESIVSFDFAIGQLPGWHVTLFPPYFVASAMFAGFALLLVILVPLRKMQGLEHVITTQHLDVLNRMLLLFSLFVAYGYVQENFFGWYGGNLYEMGTMAFKRGGTYWPIYWGTILFTAVLPQAMWIRSLRRKPWFTFAVALLVVVGAWLEQFQHVILPLAHDFLPASWGAYGPSWVDLGLMFGSIAFFVFLYLVFLKFVPAVPVSDVKKLHHELVQEAREPEGPDIASELRAGGGE